jgi:abequosyltransferase
MIPTVTIETDSSVQPQVLSTGNPRLSICIATFKRGDFIGETLDSIAPQLSEDVELLVVDGASPDNTRQVVERVRERYPAIRYICEATNSGVDQDYDKAVSYARGEYCWLMTDDDLMEKDAIQEVLQNLGDIDLLVVNAEVRDKSLSQLLRAKLLNFQTNRNYSDGQNEQLFVDVSSYLSFIGGVIVRREWWESRQRAPYYGTLFIHIGVLFQDPPITRARVISRPLLSIRFGNAMWTSRSFEIWMFKWPDLIWSFRHFSATARAAVSPRKPHQSLKRLLWFRAIGGYSLSDYRSSLARAGSLFTRLQSLAVALLPGRIANMGCALYYLLRSNKLSQLELYDLARSHHATVLARRVAQMRALQ